MKKSLLLVAYLGTKWEETAGDFQRSVLNEHGILRFKPWISQNNEEVKISSSMRANRYHFFFDAAAKHAHLNFSYPSSEVIPEKCRKMQ
jgi:hypothetical protein